MSESEFLSGRVAKRTLPVAQGPSSEHSLKRLLLPQGELAQIYDSDEAVRYIAFIELRQGGLRGNHYHKFKEERIYIIHGELELVVANRETKERESVLLQAGDLGIIRPGVAHALRTVVPGQAIEFSPVRFDPGDTYHFPLV